MAELSENEKMFIEKFHSEILNDEIEPKSPKEESIKKKSKKRLGFMKPSYWIASIATLPLTLGLGFIFLIAQTREYLGPNFDWLMANADHGPVKSIAVMANFDWIPFLATAYQNRILIVGVLAASFVFIVLISVIVENLKNKIEET